MGLQVSRKKLKTRVCRVFSFVTARNLANVAVFIIIAVNLATFAALVVRARSHGTFAAFFGYTLRSSSTSKSARTAAAAVQYDMEVCERRSEII